MLESIDLVTLAGVVALGLVHGAEPGHGWPIAATYALDSTRKWMMGLVASLVIGVGHLISSLAVVAVFFLAKSAFDITQLWWLNEVAGLLLIILGIHEYRHGHSHSHNDDTDHEHAQDRNRGQDHEHAHSSELKHVSGHGEPVPNIRTGGVNLPERDSRTDDNPGHAPDYDHNHSTNHNNDHDHSHHQSHDHSHNADLEAGAERGLWGLASAAFVLGFAHEEEFEIIGICAGTDACLSLMVAYALAVISSLVGLTLLLVAGYHRYEDRVEQVAPHFSTISAVVLVAMGVLFIAGVL